jgi:hypothetical protein
MAGRINSITTHPARELIDRALIAGESPNAIAERFADSLNPPVSRSAVYRYSRSRRSPLAPQWLTPDMTVTEAAGDLADVRASLLRLFERATERGADAAAARLAREIATVTSTLKRDFDLDADDDIATAATNAEAVALFATLLVNVPGLIAEARTFDISDDLRADLDAIEQRAADLDPHHN